MANMTKYHLKLFNLFNIANKKKIQVVSQVFLKTPTLYAVTAEITETLGKKRLGKQSYQLQEKM